MVELANVLNRMAEDLNGRMQICTKHLNELEAILAGMTDGVLAVDTQSRIIKLNDVAREYFGLGTEEVADKFILEVVRSTDLEEIIQETIEANEPVEQTVTIPLVEPQQLHCVSRPLRDHQDTPIGVLMIFNPV
jgi:two-component system phosphate regulon sensor histidine kinase PhoR